MPRETDVNIMANGKAIDIENADISVMGSEEINGYSIKSHTVQARV